MFVTLRHRTASTLSLKICRTFVARAQQQIRNTAENLTPYTYRCQDTSSHTAHDLTRALPRRSDDPPSGGRWPLARPPWRPSVGRGTKSQSRPIGRRCSFGVEPGPPAHARLSPTVADAPGPRRCLRQPARSASIGRRRTGHEKHRARRLTPPAGTAWRRPSLASGPSHDASAGAPLGPALRGGGRRLVPISLPRVPSCAILLQCAALRCALDVADVAARLPACSGSIVARR